MAKKKMYHYFCAEKVKFKDEVGCSGGISLGQHLNDVINHDVEPLSWGLFNGKLKKAIKNRKSFHHGADTFIVDPDTWTIVAHVRDSPAEKSINNHYIDALMKGDPVHIAESSPKAAEFMEYIRLEKEHPDYDFNDWIYQLYNPNGDNPPIFKLG